MHERVVGLTFLMSGEEREREVGRRSSRSILFDFHLSFLAVFPPVYLIFRSHIKTATLENAAVEVGATDVFSSMEFSLSRSSSSRSRSKVRVVEWVWEGLYRLTEWDSSKGN